MKMSSSPLHNSQSGRTQWLTTFTDEYMAKGGGVSLDGDYMSVH